MAGTVVDPERLLAIIMESLDEIEDEQIAEDMRWLLNIVAEVSVRDGGTITFIGGEKVSMPLVSYPVLGSSGTSISTFGPGLLK